LLEAAWKVRAIAIIHCPAHTNHPNKISQGNGLADRIAKEAALSEEVQKRMILQSMALPSLSSQTDQSTVQKRENRPMKRVKENSEGWFITPEGRVLIPEKTALSLVRLTHDITHLGKTVLQRLLHKYLVIP
jgi:hypothetical protein